jgi:YVTN family beta-propeller protein
MFLAMGGSLLATIMPMALRAQTTTTTAVGVGPYSAVVNPVTNTIYVLNQTSNSVSVIDGATNTVTATIPTGNLPYGLAVNPVTNTIYVGNSLSSNVTVINGATNAVTATVATGTSPNYIGVNTVTNTIYVVDEGDNNVKVINGATNTVTATVPTDLLPSAIAVNPVTNMIYVPNENGADMTVIDGATNAVVKTVPTGGDYPIAVAVNTVTNTIYVAVYNSSFVTVINGTTNAVTATVPTGSDPITVAVNSVTNTVYIPNFSESEPSGTVTVIDGATNTVTATVPVGGNPKAAGVNPVTNTIYVPNNTNNSVTVINGATNGVTATVPTGNDPITVAVNTVTNTVYVPNYASNNVTVIGGAPSTAGAPAFTVQPISVVVPGGTVALVAEASNSPTYQWMWNGTTPVSGATSSTLLLTNAAAEVGSYTCVATNSAGSATSNPATVTVDHTANIGRLVNISCRSTVGTGANILIAGFVVGGAGTTGSESLLIRGSGPALAAFGVTGTLPDPALTLDSGSTTIASNDAWGGSATISTAAAAVGAFAWSDTSSHDTALLQSLAGGAYTAQIAGESGDTGVALAEIYDATPAGSYTAATPRIVNISARVQVGTGGNILIAGFAIGGTTSRTVLIRASGPALVPFGVTGTLSDPELQLFSGSTVLLSNTAWAGNAQVASAAAAVGAFPWSSAASADSAILVTLPPGAYTAQVSGASGDTGIALVEVYEVP